MRTRTGQGGTIFKRCPQCQREVLSAFRGDVSAVGRAEIVRVDRAGDIYAACECGKTVIWERQPTASR